MPIRRSRASTARSKRSCSSRAAPSAHVRFTGSRHLRETRSWKTSHRGRLAIHAAAKKDDESLELCLQEPFRSCLVAAGLEKIGDLPFGAVVATVTLEDCILIDAAFRSTQTDQERAFGNYLLLPGRVRYAWRLSNVEPVDPSVPCIGCQGLWMLPQSVQRGLR